MQAIMRTQVDFENITTTITIEESRILTSRLLNNKMVRLDVELDGTMVDMIAKCERISRLTNDMYLELSRIANVQLSD